MKASMQNIIMIMSKKSKVRLLIPLMLMGTFIVIFYLLMLSPIERKRKIVTYVVPTVEIIELLKDSFNVTIEASGMIVAAHQEIALSTQVTGKIVNTHHNFIPGGRIAAGDIIIQIDTSDHILAVKKAQAKLSNVMASVVLEKAQQQIAKKEFAKIASNISVDETRRSLVLRKPQLNQVKAAQTIAQIEYEEAKMALERTALTLPYDVLVLETAATIGEIVVVGSVMAQLARGDEFWLELKVQQKYLARLKAQSLRSSGSKVTFQTNGDHFKGEVISIKAKLTASTKMAGIIVKVESLTSVNTGLPLIIGSHIDAVIQANVIHNVLKIPRKALLDNNQIYVVDIAEKLQLRDIKILRKMPESIIIQDDLQQHDRLVISRIAGIVPGTKVNTHIVIEQKKPIVYISEFL
ncbi:MAG: HlyD family efflux transporter periplasmic adaptor subunit [Alcanivoracaceae bacterium]|nr:HlyD family efflux transporter periplasmic adaptor subunit [Alcanivoracaceae bacterium]